MKPFRQIAKGCLNGVESNQRCNNIFFFFWAKYFFSKSVQSQNNGTMCGKTRYNAIKGKCRFPDLNILFQNRWIEEEELSERQYGELEKKRYFTHCTWDKFTFESTVVLTECLFTNCHVTTFRQNVLGHSVMWQSVSSSKGHIGQVLFWQYALST